MQLRVNTDSQAVHVQGEPLPVYLYAALEALSGYAMDDVRVHYNSDKPEQVQALAYAYGANIYLSPGQERYLPHEAWHVVQQKQGKVRPTEWLNDEIGLNTDRALEMEADFMVNVIEAQILELLYSQQFDIYDIKNRKAVSTCIKCPVIQRVGLENLVVPKVNRLTALAIPLQDSLMGSLSKKVEDLNLQGVGVFHLCSLILVYLYGKFEFNLTAPLSADGLVTPYIHKGYELIEKEHILQEDIKNLVTITLTQSGQLDYLLNNNLPNNEWEIYVDVHFYYERSKEAAAFHRDTIGHTMFVNLNYNNNDVIIGPELLIDLNKYDEHAQYISTKLPRVFLNEIEAIQAARDNLNINLKKIDVVQVPAKGIVSWVDELVDHSTPYLEHRGLSHDQILQYFLTYNETISGIIKLLDLGAETFARGVPMSADIIIQNGLLGIIQFLTGNNITEDVLRNMIAGGQLIPFLQQDERIKNVKAFREDQRPYLQKYELIGFNFNEDLINQMFAFYRKPNLQDVDISHIEGGGLGRKLNPIKPVKLERRMSQELILSGRTSFERSAEKRQFLRTWVQARKRPQL